jgi:hypothetical protein
VIGTSFGPYRIESLIGRGGMGEVYRATDTGQDGRQVALKVLGAGLSDDPQFVARFRREAEIVARISEPHVVPIHRYGEIDGRLFLDMQLVDGRELADVIAHDGPLSPDRALVILEQVGGALDAAHADGLVHRDVKPSNILLTRPGAGRPEFAYLMDFGIARATEPGSRTALTRTGAVVGTLAYMAPERFLAQPAGPASDVYSLTCVLHEMLTGARPYPGSGYAVQVTGHLHQPPPRPSTARRGLPAALDGVVARGMAKDPAARYQSGGELVAAARAALSSAGSDEIEETAAVAPDPARPNPTLAFTPKPATWVLPAAPAPSWSPGAAPVAPPPARRRRWWLPALGAAVLATAVLATVLVVTPEGPEATVTAAPPAPAGPADALPSAQPITERVIVGAAPDTWAPTVADVDGTPVLVVSRTSEAEVFDMATGERIGERIPNHSGTLTATVTRLDGRTIVVTGGVDRVIRLWDLATGEPLPTTLTGHTGIIFALAVTEVDGRKILLSGSDDQTVRRWDLATTAPLGAPLTVAGRVAAVAVTRIADRPVVLAKGFQEPIHAWDVASGASVGQAVPCVVDSITTLGLPSGPAVLSRPDYQGVAVVDLRSGAPLSGYGLEGYMSVQVAAAVVDGRPLLVDTGPDSIRLRDLRTGDPVGEPLTGHESLVSSLTTVTAGGSTFLVSTSSDRSIRIWDLTARARG